MLVLKPSFFVELKQLIITIIVSIWEKFNPTLCACAVMFYIVLQQYILTISSSFVFLRIFNKAFIRLNEISH